MMRLVQSLVYQRVMQCSVDPVDEKIGEEHKEAELRVVVPATGAVFGSVVELGVAADFEEEYHASRYGDTRHSYQGLLDFLADLVLEEFRVLESGFVEDEDVREGGEEEVVDECEDPTTSNG